MNERNTNQEHNSEHTPRARSKVTPNSAVKRKKDKLMFVGLVLFCLLTTGYMMLPESKVPHEEEARPSNASARDTLNQNLAHLAKMKAEANAYLAATHSPHETPRNHPPKLRNHQAKKSGLSQEILARMNASSSFVLDSSPSNSEESSAQTNSNHPLLVGTNANAQFINQQEDIVSVSAKRIPHPDFTVPAGELIPATLEVAMNSDLPGMVRAITKRDIYSLKGGNLLIPKGSSLVGQYSSGIVLGQSRFLIVWNRVERPDGVVITLNSPGTDALGRAGMGADRIDRHFMERFGTSALLSILGGYAAISGVGNQDQYNSKSQYRMGLANSLQQSAGASLEADMMIAPTLSLNQGASINVFVAHDLDFNAVGAVSTVNHSVAQPVRGGLWK